MTNADIDTRIINHLRRVARRDDPPQTRAEIAEALTLSPAQTRAALSRLLRVGEVRQAGIAASNARTWVLDRADPA